MYHADMIFFKQTISYKQVQALVSGRIGLKATVVYKVPKSTTRPELAAV